MIAPILYFMLINCCCNILGMEQDTTQKFKKYYYLQTNDSKFPHKIKSSHLKHSVTLKNIVHDLGGTKNSVSNPMPVNISDNLFREVIKPALKKPRSFTIDDQISLKKLVPILIAAHYLEIKSLLKKSLEKLPQAIKTSMQTSVKRTIARTDTIPRNLITKDLLAQLLEPCYVKIKSKEDIYYTQFVDNHYIDKRVCTVTYESFKKPDYSDLSIEQALIFCAMQQKKNFNLSCYLESEILYDMFNTVPGRVLIEYSLINSTNFQESPLPKPAALPSPKKHRTLSSIFLKKCFGSDGYNWDDAAHD